MGDGDGMLIRSQPYLFFRRRQALRGPSRSFVSTGWLPHYPGAMWCPNFLNSGVCPDQPECPNQHPNFFCDICGLAFHKQVQYTRHLTTKRHEKATKAVSRTLSTAPRICKVCGVKLAHPNNIPLHEGGHAHRVRLQALATRGVHYTRDEMYPVDEDVVFHCDICDSMEWHGQQQHLQSIRHKRKAAYLSVRAALDEAEKDKYGISVSYGGQEGVNLGVVDTGVRRELRLAVTSTIPDNKFLLLSAELSSSQSVNSRARGSLCVSIFSHNFFALGLIRPLQIHCYISRLRDYICQRDGDLSRLLLLRSWALSGQT